MAELTWGGLGRTIMAGINPSQLILQVIGSKPIGEQPSPDAEYKFRVVLWDGEQLYKNGLLSSGLPTPPPPYSVIRVGTSVVAPGKRDPVVKQVVQKGEASFAFVFEHYELLHEGDTINTRLQQPASSQADLLSPTNQGTSPVGSGTPAQPPALVRPTERPAQPVGREAVKRNLAADFPDPATKRFAFGTSRGQTGGAGQAGGQGQSGGAGQTAGPGQAGGQSQAASKAGQNNGKAAGVSASVASSNGGEATHEVSALNPFINKYNIKVRVSKKSGVKQIASSRWSGTVADCILSDSSGDIKLTGFESQAAALDTLLEQNATYMISGAKVQAIRNMTYNTTGHQYELVWTQYTQAAGPILSSPVVVNYKFVPISEIRSLDKGISCDLCAWVQETGNFVEFRSRADKELKKRELLLADDSGEGESSISLTLWGDLAKSFTHHNRVLAIRGATVGEFNGVKNLSLGFSGSYEVEPEQERVQQLLSWSSGLSSSNGLSQLPASQPSRSEGEDFLTVEDLKSEVMARRGGEVRASITGYILQIMDDVISYRAHLPADGTWCRRKVVDSREENMWTCQKCNKRNIPECDTALRYNVRLCLADTTSTTWCNMFEATSLFQKDAQEMEDLKTHDHNSYKALVTSLTLVPLVFSVVAKTETYNDSSRLKVSVQEVKRISWGSPPGEPSAGPPAVCWRELVSWRVAQVHSLEAQLGVAHDQEYGITWDEGLEQ